MKNLMLAEKILGMEILKKRVKGLLHLFQGGYIRKILKKFGMKEGKPVALPLAGHISLLKTMSPQTEVEAQEMERVPYSLGVKSLMYAMVYSRSDLVHVVSQVSRFMVWLDREH